MSLLVGVFLKMKVLIMPQKFTNFLRDKNLRILYCGAINEKLE